MTDKPDRPFAVITGTPAPDTPREQLYARLRKSGQATGCWCCPSCGSLTYLEVRNAVPKKGRSDSSSKMKVCAICMAKGRVVMMT